MTTTQPQADTSEVPETKEKLTVLREGRIWVHSGPLYTSGPMGTYVNKAHWTRFTGQLPYFSVTGEWYDNWHYARRNSHTRAGECQSSGCSVIPSNNKLISKLALFHLCDSDGTPMHYNANGAYTCGLTTPCAEKTEVLSIQRFYLWPDVPGDDPVDALLEFLKAGLPKNADYWDVYYGQKRLVALQAAMHQALAEAEIAWANP